MHGFAAHERRREEMATSCGVTLAQIQKHVQDTLHITLSRNTCHRLMMPPRKNTNAARGYYGKIQARISQKKNAESISGSNSDLHYTMAQVNLANELFQMHDGECLRLSCDDKNKVNVGILCVSRRMQITKYFSMDDQPVYQDHDFPAQQSKIIPSGYMLMQTRRSLTRNERSRSYSPRKSMHRREARHRSFSPVSSHSSINGSTTTDSMGRTHIPYGRTGDVYVYNRAAKFHNSSAMIHSNDLTEILKEVRDKNPKKNSVLLVSDNGPDWNPQSLQTFLYMGRLWRDSNLDCLMLTTYLPGFSRFNMIEHAWAPLTKALTSVTLSNHLPGEKAPAEQAGFTREQTQEKESVVFDAAIDLLNNYWALTYDDKYYVHSRKVDCQSVPKPYNDKEPSYAFLMKSGIQQLGIDPDYRERRKELQFLYMHAVTRSYQLEFYKCSDETCDHCSVHKVQSTKLFNSLRKTSGIIASPTASQLYPDHYKTALEIYGVGNSQTQAVNIDAEMPSRSLPNTKCLTCKYGCRAILRSDAAYQRHINLVHLAEKNMSRKQRVI